MWLLVLQLLLGAWLFAASDAELFTAAQWVTLAHVALGVLSLPVVVVFVVKHIRHHRRRSADVRRRFARWLLLASLAVAATTGVAALWFGPDHAVGVAHAAAGLAVVAPLVWHLVGSGRGALASMVLVAFSLTVGSAFFASRAATDAGTTSVAAAEGATAPFDFTRRPSALFDSASWCGECHTEIFAEWKRSAHHRSMSTPAVLSEIRQHPTVLAFNLEAAGRAAAKASEPAPPGPNPIEACSHCHAPTAYYGDAPPPNVSGDAPFSEGVTCSFCHTLRGARPAGDLAAVVARAHGLRGPRGVDVAAAMRAAPFYVSSPHAVRRYLGQGSDNPFARWLGNLLIRWRPTVHRRDYYVPFVRTSAACGVCHGFGGNADALPVHTFDQWQKSPYNTRDSRTGVQCQDCHMSAKGPTTEPVREAGRLVPWGPMRPQRRSHLFRGGNVGSAKAFGDAPLAEAQHRFSDGALSIALEHARRDGDRIAVRIAVTNERVGHRFPAFESFMRFGWVRLRALDAGGASLRETPQPDREKGLANESPFLYRCSNDELIIRCDTTIAPKETRRFDATLALPDGAGARAATVTAELLQSFDPEPIASAQRALD